eukprot:Nk52_evm6s2133 gene=Nk52_evmTU6s2133
MAQFQPVQKHWWITKERVDKFLSKQHFVPYNLWGRVYPADKRLDILKGVKAGDPTVQILHYACPLEENSFVSFEQVRGLYHAGDFQDLGKGGKGQQGRRRFDFGPSWSTHWFAVRVEIPVEWGEQEGVVLEWDSGSEACVWMEEMGSVPLQGLAGSCTGKQARTHFPLPMSGSHCTIFVEMACNGMFGCGDNGLINPPDPDRTFELSIAAVQVVDQLARDLYYDVEVLLQISEALGEESERAHQALMCANEIINTLDMDDPESYRQCRQIAARLLSHQRNPTTNNALYEVFAVGHCHIDSAWLWPYSETIRKCARSWSSQIDIMHTYPDFKFACSQAQQFEWVENFYPLLFESIVDMVKEGSFVPVGGTWVEMDGNIPSGESFIRQFMMGQKYFEEKFQKRCDIFWLPDTFGYSAQLPQIMRLCGIKYFLTQKLSWNLMNKFPHNSFYWRGIDGSTVLTHFPPADTYESDCNIKDVMKTMTANREKGRSLQGMLLFGHGDGGGGPDHYMLERLSRVKDCAGLPRVKLSTPSDFFRSLEASTYTSEIGKKNDPDVQRQCISSSCHNIGPANTKLLTWTGELYLEMHRGTFTSQAKTKLANRKAEFLLRDVEFLWSLVSLDEVESDMVKSNIDQCWKKLLLNQFHDVLPGSSIGLVYDDSSDIYIELFALLRNLFVDLLQHVMGSIFSFHIAGPHCAHSEVDHYEHHNHPHHEHRRSTASSHDHAIMRPTHLCFYNSAPFEREVIASIPRSYFPFDSLSRSVEDSLQEDTVSRYPSYCYFQDHMSSCSYSQEKQYDQLNEFFKNRKEIVDMDSLIEEESSRVLLKVNTPASGFNFVDLNKIEWLTYTPPTISRGSDDDFVLENKYLRVHIARNGVIKSMFHFESGMESFQNCHDSHNYDMFGGNLLYLYDDLPLFWDAWDVQAYYKESSPLNARKTKLLNNTSSKVTLAQCESGPLRVSVELNIHFSKSHIRQIISLDAVSKYLDVQNFVEWHEEHKLLRVEFPLNLNSASPNAAYEIQHGYVHRPTTSNTSWDVARFEVCAHKWVDLSQHGFGIALLNDCKYGFSCFDNVLGCSLLRSPKAPDEICDMGFHSFRFAIMPHSGSFQDAEVVAEAFCYNCPVQCTPGTVEDRDRQLQSPLAKNLSAISAITVSDSAIVIDVLKPSHSLAASELVVRLFESKGGACKSVKLCAPLLDVQYAYLANGLEDKTDVENDSFNVNRTLSWDKDQNCCFLNFNAFQVVTIVLGIRQHM